MENNLSPINNPEQRNIQISGAPPANRSINRQNRFATSQEPIEGTKAFLYIDAMDTTLSTIYGSMPDGMLASEYFVTPKRARSNDDVAHKVSGNNIFMQGDTERLDNMIELYICQTIRREETFLVWDTDAVLQSKMQPVLDKYEYQTHVLSLSVEDQQSIMDRLDIDTLYVPSLADLIDVTAIEQQLLTISDSNPKTAIFLCPAKMESSKKSKQLYQIFLMYIYRFLINVARTSGSRYFYWPVHVLLPEVDVFGMNEYIFPVQEARGNTGIFAQLEVSRYRGILSLLGTNRVPDSLEFLVYRGVIHTSFVNNLLILEGEFLNEMINKVDSALGIDMRKLNAQLPNENDYVRVLTEMQIRRKKQPIILKEFPVAEHPIYCDSPRP